jgi:hypothetical protein
MRSSTLFQPPYSYGIEWIDNRFELIEIELEDICPQLFHRAVIVPKRTKKSKSKIKGSDEIMLLLHFWLTYKSEAEFSRGSAFTNFCARCLHLDTASSLMALEKRFGSMGLTEQWSRIIDNVRWGLASTKVNLSHT